VKLKRGDNVIVIAGKYKGHKGKVLVVDRAKNRVIVEGANMVMRHLKAGAGNQQSQIVKKEAPIHASNVMYLYEGHPTRIGYKVEETEINGRIIRKKYRVAKSTGDTIE
jgi:large subunit ribosomal protein L24